jgi:putative alpha-1,2-mannosidase
VPYYTLTTPTFKKVIIHLDTKYYDKDKLVIETEGTGDYIQSISLGGKKSGYRVSHQDLIKAGGIKFTLSDKH